MSMFSAGMGLQGDMSHLKNDFKLQDMVVSSPTKWPYYVLGMAASEIVYSDPCSRGAGNSGSLSCSSERLWSFATYCRTIDDVFDLYCGRLHFCNFF